MNTKLKKNLMRGLAAATAVVAMAGAFAAPAMAGTGTAQNFGPKLGNLFLTIPDGNASSLFLMNTDAPCPVGQTYVAAFISHVDTLPAPQDPKNTWFNEVLRSTNNNNTSNTVPFSVPINNTITSIAGTLGLNLPSGDYNLRVRCGDSLSTVQTGYFEQNITIANPTTPANNAAATYTTVAKPPVVTPTVATTPATVDQNVSTVLSATVAGPAESVTGKPRGTVQFMDGVTSIGGLQTLDATGKASVSFNSAVLGAHSITAVYSGDPFYFNPATSPAAAVTVAAVPNGELTTAAIAVAVNGTNVSTSPANISTTDNVTLSGTVTAPSFIPTTAAEGTCQYMDGAALVGSPVALTNGVCGSMTLGQLPAKAYNYTVKFLTANAGRYLASESSPFRVNADTSLIAPAVETINVTVEAGALTISLKDPAKSQVNMTTPVLTPDASMLTSTGTMQTVTVADLRAGNPGWTATGQVTDFKGMAMANTGKIIRGNNLGWTPIANPNKSASQTIDLGGPVASPNLPIDAAAPASALGLFSPSALASAAANHGTGTADLDANLTLNVPTNPVAGLYTATLTLTVA